MSNSNNASIKTNKRLKKENSIVVDKKDDLRKESGVSFLGFSVSRCNTKVGSKKEKDGADAASNEIWSEVDVEYHNHLETYSASMSYLIEYIYQAGRNATESCQTNYAEMYRMLCNMIYSAAKSSKKATDEVTLHFFKKQSREKVDIVFPVVDGDELSSIRRYHNAAEAAPRILAASMIQQIVNSWEHLLGSLICTRIDSAILKKNRNIQISFAELKSVKDVLEVKRIFVKKIVREFMRKNIDEQISELNTEYKIDLSSSLMKETLADFKETIERRHAIVHCNSIATSEYCDYIKALGKAAPAVGEELFSPQRYLLHAWDIFFAVGVVVSNMFRVLHARLLKSQEMEAWAFRELVVASHAALEHGRNESACIMLRYADGLSIKDDWSRLATKINLALAYKRMGQVKESLKVLDGHDWHYSDDEFKAAVAALHGKNKDALKRIIKICRKDPAFVRNAHEWVVFEDVRRDADFEKSMQQLASRRGKVMVKVPAPAVHFSKDSDEEARLNKLFEIATKFSLNQLV